jgi:sortase A
MRRRNLQILGWALIWSGIFIFGYLGWQLFGTDVVNARVQAVALTNLEDNLEESREDLPPEVEVEVEEGTPSVVLHPEEAPADDQELGMLRVPSLGIEVVIFQGIGVETLKKGPGHMPGTALPGQPGNAVISGHRTTYGRPFFDFDQLAPGDRIEIETAIGLHVYEVDSSFIVDPTDVWVIDDKPGAWLTLTTCHPKFSARERLIITAQLVDGPNLEYVMALQEQMQTVS